MPTPEQKPKIKLTRNPFRKDTTVVNPVPVIATGETTVGVTPTKKDGVWQTQYQDAVNTIIAKNPSLKEDLPWQMIEPAAKAINGRYDGFIEDYKNSPNLHKALTNFKTVSLGLGTAIKSMAAKQDQIAADNYNNAMIAYVASWKALSVETNKKDSPLAIYNGRLYNQKDFKKVNQSPYLANEGSADLLLKGAGPKNIKGSKYNLSDYYKDLPTSASYERKNQIEKQGQIDILKTLDPIYKSYVNKSFAQYDPKNVDKNLTSNQTANIYLNLITSVANYGTLGDDNLKNKQMAKSFLQQYTSAQPSDKAKLILSNKDVVKNWTNDLSFHQKYNLFQNAYKNTGTNLYLYPTKQTDPENINATNILTTADWKLKADLLQEKFKAYKKYAGFEKNYGEAAKEKFYVNFSNTTLIGNKNELSGAESKRLMESIFDSNTGNFISFNKWDSNEENKKMGNAAVYKQLGYEIKSGWNKTKDAFSNFYHQTQAYESLRQGDTKGIAENLSKINQNSELNYRREQRKKLFQDLRTAYKKSFDDVELKNVRGFDKSKIGYLKNVYNTDLEYKGLDLRVDKNNIVINNEEGKQADAIKIINLLKADNDNTVWDTEMISGITVFDDEQKKRGFNSITQNQLSKYKQKEESGILTKDQNKQSSNSKILKNFFKGNGLDDVQMTLHKNTSVKDFSRYEFIKNLGEENEESISMFIPKKLLSEEEGVNDYFYTATNETLAQFMFKLNGEEHEMGITRGPDKKPNYTKATLSLQEEAGQQVYVGTIVYEKDGNPKIYEYRIPNGSFISFEDAYSNFNSFLSLPELKASLQLYDPNN